MGFINIFKLLSTFLQPAPLINLSSINKNSSLKKLRNAFPCWVRSKYASSVLCWEMSVARYSALTTTICSSYRSRIATSSLTRWSAGTRTSRREPPWRPTRRTCSTSRPSTSPMRSSWRSTSCLNRWPPSQRVWFLKIAWDPFLWKNFQRRVTLR